MSVTESRAPTQRALDMAFRIAWTRDLPRHVALRALVNTLYEARMQELTDWYLKLAAESLSDCPDAQVALGRRIGELVPVVSLLRMRFAGGGEVGPSHLSLLLLTAVLTAACVVSTDEELGGLFGQLAELAEQLDDA